MKTPDRYSVVKEHIPTCSWGHSYAQHTLMVEMSGIEPLTPCLQSRCSPN